MRSGGTNLCCHERGEHWEYREYGLIWPRLYIHGRIIGLSRRQMAALVVEAEPHRNRRNVSRVIIGGDK